MPWFVAQVVQARRAAAAVRVPRNARGPDGRLLEAAPAGLWLWRLVPGLAGTFELERLSLLGPVAHRVQCCFSEQQQRQPHHFHEQLAFAVSARFMHFEIF